MWLTGLVAPRHVGSSQTRARTRVPCTGRQTLNHCATREAQLKYFDDENGQRWGKHGIPEGPRVSCLRNQNSSQCRDGPRAGQRLGVWGQPCCVHTRGGRDLTSTRHDQGSVRMKAQNSGRSADRGANSLLSRCLWLGFRPVRKLSFLCPSLLFSAACTHAHREPPWHRKGRAGPVGLEGAGPAGGPGRQEDLGGGPGRCHPSSF